MRLAAPAVLAFILSLLMLSSALAERLEPALQRAVYEAQQAMNEKGDYPLAREVIQDYLDSHPDRPHHLAFYVLGLAWQKEGRLEEAARAYGQALALAPDYYPACLNLAATLYQLDRPGEAARLWERAYYLADPPDGRLLYQAAVAYSQAEALDRAEDILIRLLSQSPDKADHWLLLGQVRLGQENYLAAATALEVAYALEEPKQAGWKSLADIYFFLGAPLKGVRTLAKAYGPAPTAEECQEMAGWLFQAERAEAAIEYLDRGIMQEPTAEGYLEKGRMLYDLGRYDEAVRALEAAVKLAPEAALAQLLLGLAALEVDRLGLAGKALRRAATDKEYEALAQRALESLEQEASPAP